MIRVLIALVMLLTGCAQQHAVLMKSDGNLTYAQADLVACKFEAELPSQDKPVLAGLGLDNNYRNNVITQCLRSRGYKVIVELGPCLTGCIDKAEFRPGSSNNDGQISAKPLVNPNEQVDWVP